MRFAELVQSQNLQISHYQDIDHFRQGLRGASVDIVPLANVDVPLGQAVLGLPGCDILLMLTFPRVFHTMLERNCVVVLLSMRDMASVIFNGRLVAQSVLKFARGPVEYRVVEKAPGYFAALMFSPETANRGWPETAGEFLDIPVSRDLELALRRMVDRLFTTASQNPDLTAVPAAGAAMADSLMQMLDLAFNGHPVVASTGREAGHDRLRAVRAIDHLIDCDSSGPLYSGEIAAKLGISVRSLTNLMARTSGMSLQRYIRTRRLWSVRRQLLSGDPRRQIKEIALANGFWHLGDFAAKYFSQFGELPSSTQVNSRR